MSCKTKDSTKSLRFYPDFHDTWLKGRQGVSFAWCLWTWHHLPAVVDTQLPLWKTLPVPWAKHSCGLTHIRSHLILVTLEVGVVISCTYEELKFTVKVVVQVTDLKIGRAGIQRKTLDTRSKTLKLPQSEITGELLGKHCKMRRS